MKPFVAFAALLFSGGVALAEDAVVATPSECWVRLAKVAEFAPLPALNSAGGCGAPDPVLLRSVILPDRAKVAMVPPATLRCTMAEGIAHWLIEDVAPAVLKFGAPLRGVDNFDSYECRSRNRVPGAGLSEHGRANALDVRGFRLGNGRSVELTDVNVPQDWRIALRTNACARFNTVLGPGSDGYHEQHIHLDLAERHSGYKLCHWEVHGLPPAHAVAAMHQPSTVDAVASVPVRPAVPASWIAESTEAVPLPRPRPRMGRGGYRHIAAPIDIHALRR